MTLLKTTNVRKTVNIITFIYIFLVIFILFAKLLINANYEIGNYSFHKINLLFLKIAPID